IGRVYREVGRKNPPPIQLDPDELQQAVDTQVAEFFQIDSTWGSFYRSESLAGRSLPFDPTILEDRLLGEVTDDLVLAPDIPVRRVILKVPAVGRMMPFFGRGRGPRPGQGGPPLPPAVGARGDRPRRRPRPSIFVQCAYDRRKLDITLQPFKADRDRELAALQGETTSSLKSLRNSLLTISTVTFAATAVGCFALVWLGLAPLRRLSDAVGRVSPKGFRLPLDARRLPARLHPAGRPL